SLLMDCSTGATSVKKGLEKMNHMDSDFVNHPDWSTIVEILLLGLCRYTLQLDVNNVNTNHYCAKKESPITNIPIRYLQVYTSIIQALVQSRAIEEDTNTTIAVMCASLYNLLQTLKEIFFLKTIIRLLLYLIPAKQALHLVHRSRS
ncbi:MAG: hypothetical protein ACK53Y_10720, partial [bacterium]